MRVEDMHVEYYGTVSLSNLLKFITLRVHEGVQWKIQELTRGMLEIAAGLESTAVEVPRDNGEER